MLAVKVVGISFWSALTLAAVFWVWWNANILYEFTRYGEISEATVTRCWSEGDRRTYSEMSFSGHTAVKRLDSPQWCSTTPLRVIYSRRDPSMVRVTDAAPNAWSLINQDIGWWQIIVSPLLLIYMVYSLMYMIRNESYWTGESANGQSD